VSGLAYGIDYHAHLASLKYNLKTIAVLGHGLHTIYPSQHRNLAFKIIDNGCICSDFASNMNPERKNFIKRNRVIAGLSDATIVIESGEKGGALITADIAGSYNRDVFAFPGRTDEIYSKGCNQLIRRNGASLIEGIDDLEYFMGWETTEKEKFSQPSLFIDLTPDEEKVVDLLKEENPLIIDQISSELKMPGSKVSSLLMNMEFKNLVFALPGKMYKLR
jgi:DNA processing protein